MIPQMAVVIFFTGKFGIILAGMAYDAYQKEKGVKGNLHIKLNKKMNSKLHFSDGVFLIQEKSWRFSMIKKGRIRYVEENGKKFIWKLTEDEMYWLIFDAETGKQISSKMNVRLGDTVVRKEDRERRKQIQKKNEELEWIKKRGFIQFKRAIREIAGKSKQYHAHLFVKLLPLVSFADKPLSLEGKPLNQSQIAEYLRIHQKVASEFLHAYVELGILEEVKGERNNEKFYRLAGKYIVKGEFEEKERYSVKVFQKQIQKVIELVEIETKKYINQQQKNKMELWPLSLLLTLLPYVHYQAHILCENYDEDFFKNYSTISQALKYNKRLIKQLTDKKIWREMTGQDVVKLSVAQQKKLKIYFDILKKANVIATFDGKNKMYIINPNLVFITAFTQDEQWTKTLQGLFTM
ncbi:hypothetical protein B9L23_15650 [Parageobacillus galactosidasius]|uniref:Uncharacterized protein n=1 Tax=Parageobacillus galactosidasius TaxID=883812 RepID=A0A226QJ68_9BACL|nr:hypothetical protein B9L23_15650 [Parageobacillus galactosidasius]